MSASANPEAVAEQWKAIGVTTLVERYLLSSEGLTPPIVRDYENLGIKLRSEIVWLFRNGLTPEVCAQYEAEGVTGFIDITTMNRHKVRGGMITELRKSFPGYSIEEIIQMRKLKISSTFLGEMRRYGVNEAKVMIALAKKFSASELAELRKKGAELSDLWSDGAQIVLRPDEALIQLRTLKALDVGDYFVRGGALVNGANIAKARFLLNAGIRPSWPSLGNRAMWWSDLIDVPEDQMAEVVKMRVERNEVYGALTIAETFDATVVEVLTLMQEYPGVERTVRSVTRYAKLPMPDAMSDVFEKLSPLGGDIIDGSVGELFPNGTEYEKALAAANEISQCAVENRRLWKDWAQTMRRKYGRVTNADIKDVLELTKRRVASGVNPRVYQQMIEANIPEEEMREIFRLSGAYPIGQPRFHKEIDIDDIDVFVASGDDEPDPTNGANGIVSRHLEDDIDPEDEA